PVPSDVTSYLDGIPEVAGNTFVLGATANPNGAGGQRLGPYAVVFNNGVGYPLIQQTANNTASSSFASLAGSILAPTSQGGIAPIDLQLGMIGVATDNLAGGAVRMDQDSTAMIFAEQSPGDGPNFVRDRTIKAVAFSNSNNPIRLGSRTDFPNVLNP